jgi:hypothetical protein
MVPVRLDALPAGPKLTFFPRRSSDRLDVCIGEDVHLGNRQADDVIDPGLVMADKAKFSPTACTGFSNLVMRATTSRFRDRGFIMKQRHYPSIY